MQQAEYYREFGMVDIALECYYEAISLLSHDENEQEIKNVFAKMA